MFPAWHKILIRAKRFSKWKKRKIYLSTLDKNQHELQKLIPSRVSFPSSPQKSNVSQGLEIVSGNERFNRRNRFTRGSDFSTAGYTFLGFIRRTSSPRSCLSLQTSGMPDNEAHEHESRKREGKRIEEDGTSAEGGGWRALSAGNRTRVETTDSYRERGEESWLSW